MDRITTYCELDFIDNFLNNIPKASLLELFINVNNDIDGFKVLYSLIFKRSNLVINKSKQELATSDDPFHKMLVRGYTDGYSRLIDLGEAFTNEFDENGELAEFPNHVDSLFLLNKFGVNKIKELGFFSTNVTSNYIKQVQELSYQKKYFVANSVDNDFEGWSCLSRINLPINSAIISDNHILDDSSRYQYNAFSILKNILPPSLKCSFHLTFIVRHDIPEYTNKAELINDYIKKLNLSYKVMISIFFTAKNAPHDRDIITNYYWIHSGHSFDYYSDKGKINRTTHLEISSILSGSNSDNFIMMNKILNYYKEILLNKEPDYKTTHFTNRLLE
jgi:hypothetical protein